MIRTKCILAPPCIDDGTRISVMNRHTRCDGVTTDERIAKVIFAYHLPIFGPSSRLLGDYYKRGLPWEGFATRYFQEMTAPEQMIFVRRLAWWGLTKTITLLCIEDDPSYCHRQLLALLLRREYPQLEIQHCW